MTQVDVALPSGGRISGEFAQAAGVEIKALIKLGDQTILGRTLDVLRSVERVRRIVVIGPEAALAEARAHGADGAIAEGGTGPENIFRGLEWLSAQEGGCAARVLLAATDLPFLSVPALNAFLDACPPDADVCVPVIPRKTFETRFPGSENIWVPLREGPITNGSVFLVNPETLLRNRTRFEGMFAARKSQWQMARLVGWRIALELLTKRLSIHTLEVRCGQIIGGKGVGIRDSAPELAFDVDQLSEFAYAQRAAPATS